MEAKGATVPDMTLHHIHSAILQPEPASLPLENQQTTSDTLG